MAVCTCYPVEKQGVEYNHFIAETFGECVYSVREISSFMIGMSSLFFWFCCQTPQFIKNYRRKSGKALSKWFLIEWFLGDALNLVGCILTQQLITQLATSVLFIFVDVAMISQISYYTCFYNHEVKAMKDMGIQNNQRGRGQTASSSGSRFSELDVGALESDTSSIDDSNHNDSENINDSNTINADQARRRSNLTGRSIRILTAAALPISVVLWTMNTPTAEESHLKHSQRILESASSYVFSYAADTSHATFDSNLPNCEPDPHLSKGVQSTGVALGWISAIVYLNSRLPQLFKNYKRQSVDGLSWVMFFCAVMGNLTYGLGVLLKDSSPEALLKALPWLTGSLGTLSLDFFILLQFYLYPSKPSERSSEAYAYMRLDDAGTRSNSLYDIRRESPARGLFGIKSWTTSPLFKPRSFYEGSTSNNYNRAVPRDNFSHGVLPSEVPSLNLPPSAAFSSIAQHMEEENEQGGSGSGIRSSGIQRADSF